MLPCVWHTPFMIWQLMWYDNSWRLSSFLWLTLSLSHSLSLHLFCTQFLHKFLTTTYIIQIYIYFFCLPKLRWFFNFSIMLVSVEDNNYGSQVINLTSCIIRKRWEAREGWCKKYQKKVATVRRKAQHFSCCCCRFFFLSAHLLRNVYMSCAGEKQ